MHYLLLTINWGLMILMPIALGWIIAKKRGIKWGLFAIGGATFILSQIAHIPFNWVMFNSLSDELEGLSANISLLIVALLAGLSAGIFEEGARYLTYRYWAKDARSWGSGMMLGAGHGGAESIILGILVALNVGFLWFFEAGRFTSLVPEEQRPLIYESIAQMIEQPWYAMLLGAVERAFALSIHLALSLIVLQVFLRKQIRWLFAAVAWHALVDASAVIAASYITPLQVEIVIGVFGIISILIIFFFKAPEPSIPTLRPTLEPMTGSLVINVTPENIDDSRYE